MTAERHRWRWPRSTRANARRGIWLPHGGTPRTLLVVIVLVVGLLATFAVAQAGAQQPGGESQTRLLASRTPDRAAPVVVDDLTLTSSDPVYVFVDAPGDPAEDEADDAAEDQAQGVGWVAFYVDLTRPDQLGQPFQVETQAPWDLAGTTADGQASPLDPAELGVGTHRITAVVGFRDSSQTLHTGTIQLDDPTPTPTPSPSGTPEPAPTAPPTTSPANPETSAPGQQAIGVHQDLHYGVRSGAIDAAARLGAAVSRSSFLWDKIEPEQGQRDWSSSDQFISQLVDAGIDPLLYFVGSPSWANNADDRFAVPVDQAEFDQWVSQYAKFAQAAAERYRGQVTRWQIGNEQNQSDFWRPDPSPERYRAWYVAMREAILAGNPDAEVSIGGLAGLTASGETTGLDFLGALIEADTPIDVVSVHPYPGQGQAPDVQLGNENDFTDIQLVHQALQDAGRSEVPIWVTEWGWSSSQVGEQTQADYVQDSLRILQDLPYVQVATYFLDYDRQEFDHGLLRSDLSGKPAAQAFTAGASNPSANPPAP